MPRGRRYAWISWSAIALLAVLCGAVAFLQFRWIGEISQAEQQRLRDDLHDQLEEVRRHFNDQIYGAAMSLQPQPDDIRRFGMRAAFEANYGAWRTANGSMFSRIALEDLKDGKPSLYILDPQKGAFEPAAVPREWADLSNRLEARAERRPPDRSAEPSDWLLERPVFGSPGPEASPGRAWLILELNMAYLRDTLLPESLRRYLATSGKLDYQVEVVPRADPSRKLYRWGDEFRAEDEDGEIALLDEGGGPGAPGAGMPQGAFPPPGPDQRAAFKQQPPGNPRNGGQSARKGRGKNEDRAKPAFFGEPLREIPPPPEPPTGRWLLRVRHRTGSLEVLVAQTRRRNLAVSAGLLVLILATSLVLVRYTRRMRELAELQMNFVAGVSHELRTPLTVIRTAAFNLRRGRVQNSDGQDRVEQYGTLIEEESEKLTALVEQVLQFGSSSNNTKAIRQRAPVAVGRLIDDALEASQLEVRAPGIEVEKHIPAELPRMLGDRVALQHLFQNLIDNALKYGTIPQNWIGISAALLAGKGGRWVEIRVGDHGPGIPREEQSRIFDPFFRGQRAIDDQIHGTGLGLNLVKRIVDAHGGSIRVESEPGAGTTFVIRIPTAAEGTNHEFTNSVG